MSGSILVSAVLMPSVVDAPCAPAATNAQSPPAQPLAVTADNFTRAETDNYFANIVKQAGGPGRFFHRREIEPIDNQNVIRGNRDTVYSAAVFDLDAGPVTVTLPDARGRFMSMIVIDEDQYTPAVYYGAGTHIFNRQQIGTRYLMLALRTFVDPSDPADLKKVHVPRSPFTTLRAAFRRTPTTRTRSTTSRPRRVRTVQSPSSSVAAMARFPTACQRCQAGTTWCASIGRAPKS